MTVNSILLSLPNYNKDLTWKMAHALLEEVDISANVNIESRDSQFPNGRLCKLNIQNMPKNSTTHLAPTYLLLPLGKRGLKWGDFHWAMGCV